MYAENNLLKLGALVLICYHSTLEEISIIVHIFVGSIYEEHENT